MNRQLSNLVLSIVTATVTVSATVGMAIGASAQVTTSNPNLPPINGAYFGAPGSTVSYPAYGITLSNLADGSFTGIVRNQSGANEVDTFNSALTGIATSPSFGSLVFQDPGPISVTLFGKAGQTTGTFATQITSMDFTGNLAGHSVEIRVDPTNPSTGQTTITDVGGGLFRIDSFFDIFTDLSVDGGAFAPSNGFEVMTLQQTDLPEPGALALFIGAGTAAIALRRRKAGK